MTAQRKHRVIVFAALLAVVAAAVAAFSYRMAPGTRDTGALPVMSEIGGDFELTRAGGARVRLRDYHGRAALLFFGYTHCPDVCPTALYTLKTVMDELGSAADAVTVAMITVDPQHDTPEHLDEYVRYFHPRFVGLGGTGPDIEKVAGQYRVYYRDESAPAGERVAHSAYVYLLDRRQRVRAVFASGAGAADIAESVREVLKEADAPAG